MPPKKSIKKLVFINELDTKDSPIIKDVNKTIPDSDDEVKVEDNGDSNKAISSDDEVKEYNNVIPSSDDEVKEDNTKKNTKSAKARTTKSEKIAKSDSDSDDTKKKRNISAISPKFVDDMLRSVDGINLNKKDMKIICEKFIDNLVSKVMSGDSVQFTNNMTFKRVERKARTHINIQTNEPVEKPKHYIMTMSVMPALKKSFENIEIV